MTLVARRIEPPGPTSQQRRLVPPRKHLRDGNAVLGDGMQQNSRILVVPLEHFLHDGQQIPQCLRFP